MSNRLRYSPGIALILIGAAALVWIPFFYLRSNQLGTSYIHKFDNAIHKQGTTTTVGSTSSNTNLVGKIKIPKLSLEAPIVEGTSSDDLEAAVGHLSGSVLPGKKGTSILAAHNVTWFRHLDQLKSGDTFEIVTPSTKQTYRVTGSSVVRVGYQAKNTATPSVILEACYPLDAWYLTSYRYLVYAYLE